MFLFLTEWFLQFVCSLRVYKFKVPFIFVSDGMARITARYTIYYLETIVYEY